MNPASWRQIEADFREWAFYHYHAGPFSCVKSNTERFALSLLASVAPIKDRQAVIQWHRLRKRCRTAEELEQIAAESVERQASILQHPVKRKGFHDDKPQ